MRRQDLEHLNLLAILHYVLAGMTVLFSMLPLLYAVVGMMFIAGGGGPGAAGVGWFFLIGFGGTTLLMWAEAGLTIMAGIFLHRHKARTFCFVVAAINCTQMPLGTALGIFTILVLCRESVQEVFATGGQYRDPEDEDDHPPSYDDRFDRDRLDHDDHRDDWRREEPGYYGRDDHDH